MPARIAAPLCDGTGKFQNKQDHNYRTKPIEKRAGHTTKSTSSSNSGPGPGIIYIQAPLMIAHVTTKANSQFRQHRTGRGEMRRDEMGDALKVAIIIPRFNTRQESLEFHFDPGYTWLLTQMKKL